MKTLWFVFILAVWTACVFCYSELSNEELSYIDRSKNLDLLDPTNPNGYLAPILQVRTPGSQGSKNVQRHFQQFFNDLTGWHVKLEEFTMAGPQGQVNFTNVIATRDPPGVEKRLTLVAHYDSKLLPDGFVGAIDSAFPCALIMYVVKQLNDVLTTQWKHDRKIGLQVLFLDGEEALEEWTDDDSIYGARYLAQKMEEKGLLNTIDMFVLLDLLGAKSPSVMSMYEGTDWAHKNMKNVEKRLRKQKFAKHKRSEASWFARPGRFFIGGMLGDDHIPFLQRGVPVLHLIPYPFPETWHELSDNAQNLDEKAMHDWALLMTVWTAEYLELSGGFGIENVDL